MNPLLMPFRIPTYPAERDCAPIRRTASWSQLQRPHRGSISRGLDQRIKGLGDLLPLGFNPWKLAGGIAENDIKVELTISENHLLRPAAHSQLPERTRAAASNSS